MLMNSEYMLMDDKMQRRRKSNGNTEGPIEEVNFEKLVYWVSKALHQAGYKFDANATLGSLVVLD